jgi:hypothetical protein
VAGLPAWASTTATTTTLAVTSGGSPVSTVISPAVVTLTATVKAGTTAISPGVVTFCDASASYCTDIHLLGTAQLTSAGTASMKFVPGPGSHSYKAVFAGTTNYAASSSTNSSLSVTGKYPTISTITASGISTGYTLNATVGTVGENSPTGTESFEDASNSNAVLGTASLVAGTAGFNYLNGLNSTSFVGPAHMVKGDFNGDGFLDLAIENENAATLTILLGDGHGNFTPTSASPFSSGPGFYPKTIAAGDFNNDGKLDLVVGDNSNQVIVFLGDGTGNFTEGNFYSTGMLPAYIAVADFNHDGNLDLAIANYNSNNMTILLGNGDGTFTPATGSPITTNANPLWIQAGILRTNTSSTNTDLVVMDQGVNTVQVFLGNGNGTFALQTSPPTLTDTPAAVALVDLTGNGKLDMAIPYGPNGFVEVFQGNGDGTFTAQSVQSSTGQLNKAIDYGDFNGDGIVDLVLPGFEDATPGVVTTLFGWGDYTFENAAPTPATGLEAGLIVAGDFNGDGVPDVAVTNFASNTLTILETVDAVATAQKTGIVVAAGTHNVFASYPGDSNYLAGNSATTTLITNPPTPTLSISCTPNPVGYQQVLTCSSTVSGDHGGTIAFTINGVAWTSGAPNSSGTFSATRTVGVTSGSYTLAANYSGDPNYGPATASVVVTAEKTTPTLSIGCTPNPIAQGQVLTCTSTVSGDFGGTIAFTINGVAWTSGAPNGSGTFSATRTVGVSSGSYTIAANYSGDTGYNSATNSVVVTVGAAPTLSINCTPNPVAYHQTLTCSSTVSGDHGGTIAFTINGVAWTSGAPNGSGTFSATRTVGVASGSYTLTANYSGDANYPPATASQVVTATQVTPTLSMNCTPNPVAQGTVLTCTSTVSGDFGGTIAFTINGVAWTSGAPNGSGTFSATRTVGVSSGTYTVAANYSGDTDYAAATNSVQVTAEP